MIDQKKMHEALDIIARGIVQPSKVALLIGMKYRNFRNWLVRSNRGDPQFLIEVDGEQLQFAKAVALARRLAMFELRGKLETYSIMGVEEVSYMNGQVVWALDPAACAIDDLELREMLFGRRDGLLVVNGALVPVTQHKQAPIALQLRLLEATFRDLRPSSVQEINQNINGSVSVGIAHAPRMDYSRPPVIPPLPIPPPQLEILPDPAVNAEEDFEDLLGPVPVDDPEPIIEPEPAPALEPLAEERDKDEPDSPPPPLKIDDPPQRPATTPLMESLYAELKKARERKVSP